MADDLEDNFDNQDEDPNFPQDYEDCPDISDHPFSGAVSVEDY